MLTIYMDVTGVHDKNSQRSLVTGYDYDNSIEQQAGPEKMMCD
jgi:hypothetical protein